MSIHNAVRSKDVPRVMMMLGQQPSILESEDEYGHTPLYVAVTNNLCDMATYLLEERAEINTQRIRSYTPLWCACYYGHLDMVKLLIRHGADPNLPSRYGVTPLMIASEVGHEHIAQHLLQHHKIVRRCVDRRDDMGRTTFHYACMKANPGMMELLGKAGASVLLADKDGNTPKDIMKRPFHNQHPKRDGCLKIIEVSE